MLSIGTFLSIELSITFTAITFRVNLEIVVKQDPALEKMSADICAHSCTHRHISFHLTQLERDDMSGIISDHLQDVRKTRKLRRKKQCKENKAEWE